MKPNDIKERVLSLAVIAALFLFTAFFSLSACVRDADARELRLGAYKYLSDGDMQKLMQPFVKYLSAAVKAPIKLYITSTYSELSQRFMSGEMDMAIIPPYAYVKLADKIKLKLLASMKLEGSYYYNGAIVTRKSSGIDKPEKLSGKNFAYVAPDSASGYLYPRVLLKKRGLNPDSMFARTEYTGSHIESVKALVSGKVDGIAIFKSALDFVKLQGIDTADVQVVAETENIPHEAFIAQHNMDEAFAHSVKQALINYRYDPADPVLAEVNPSKKSMFKMEGWVVGIDSLYDAVREIQKFFPNPELENPDKDTNAVVVGYFPKQDVDTTLKMYEPLLAYLSKETGFRFKMAFSPNILDVGNQMLDGNYDMTILSPVSYVMATEKSRIPIVTLVQRSNGGRSTYKGLIVCRAKDGYGSVKDLAGKTFAFTDPDSLSGRLYPLALFKKNNIMIKTFFKKTYYAGSTKKALADVVSGTADACACNEYEYVRMTSDPKYKDFFKVLLTTPELPADMWSMLQTTRPALRDKIKAALLKINTVPELKSSILDKIVYDRFVEPNPSGIEELRGLLKLIM